MRKRMMPAVGGVLIAALALAGCAANPEPPSEPITTLVVAPQYAIESLDPYGPNSSGKGYTQVAAGLYSRLVAPDADGQIQPDLAESWESNDAGTEYTFHLREDATFSDGSPVTAADVASSFEHTIEVEAPIAPNFTGISVEATDEHTVVFTRSSLILLGQIALLYVTKNDGTVDELGNPLGSGPYVSESLKPGETLVLTRRDDYWGEAPGIETLEFRWIPEVSTRVTALQTGEVDVTWGIPDDQVSALSSDEALTVEVGDTTQVLTMWFNHKRPALQSAEVRNAIWQAIDFESIITALFPNTGSVSLSNIAPSVFGYAPNEAKGYDPEAAKSALEEAGFDFGQTIQIQYRESDYTQFVAAMASDLAEIGVTLEPVQKEPATWSADFSAFNWDVNFQLLGTAAYDASLNTGRLYTCAADRLGYCNPELDEVLADAVATADQDQRAELYAEAGSILWEDAVGMFPMQLRTTWAWNSAVVGITPDPVLEPNLWHLSSK